MPSRVRFLFELLRATYFKPLYPVNYSVIELPKIPTPNFKKACFTDTYTAS